MSSIIRSLSFLRLSLTFIVSLYLCLQYIVDLRNQRRANVMAKRTGQKSVLILGAGYVAGPLVDYLTRDKDVHVTVASELYGQGKRRRPTIISYCILDSVCLDNVWQW